MILKLDCNLWGLGTQIVAPHIHYLRFINSQLSSTFVAGSSLAEAKLDLCFVSTIPTFQDDFLQLQVMALTMLEKLQNVEKLTLKENFLHILSLAEVRGVPFPMLKVKYLTLETVIFRYVIPGIERVLQNSPDLKQLTVHAKNCNNAIREEDLDNYLEQEGLNPDQCWRSKDGVDWNTSRLDVEQWRS